MINQKELAKANQLWDMVLNVNAPVDKGASLAGSGLKKIMKDASESPLPLNPKPREEVLRVARFIANIAPAYVNSQGQYVHLVQLRISTEFSEEDIAYLVDRIEEVVKPFINISTEDAIVGGKLKVKTSMPKKKLLHAAIRHLLTGSEVLADPQDFFEIIGRAAMYDEVKVTYAWLVGMAKAANYPSVPAFMEDLCIKFIDQTEHIRHDGSVHFYDQSLRIESLV